MQYTRNNLNCLGNKNHLLSYDTQLAKVTGEGAQQGSWKGTGQGHALPPKKKKSSFLGTTQIYNLKCFFISIAVQWSHSSKILRGLRSTKSSSQTVVTIFLNSIIPNRGLCQCEYIKCLSISFLMEMTFETFKVFLPNLATLYLVMPQLLSSKRKSMNGKSPKITAAATKTHLNQFWKNFGCGCCWCTVLQKL